MLVVRFDSDQPQVQQVPEFGSGGRTGAGVASPQRKAPAAPRSQRHSRGGRVAGAGRVEMGPAGLDGIRRISDYPFWQRISGAAGFPSRKST